MFTAALFTIARTWKQPKCPSTDEWVKKMWHIYTVEYYSAIKRNKIELLVVRWMNLYMESKKKKKGSEEPRGRTGIKTQTYRMDLRTRGRGRVSWDEVRE